MSEIFQTKSGLENGQLASLFQEQIPVWISKHGSEGKAVLPFFGQFGISGVEIESNVDAPLFLQGCTQVSRIVVDVAQTNYKVAPKLLKYVGEEGWSGLVQIETGVSTQGQRVLEVGVDGNRHISQAVGWGEVAVSIGDLVGVWEQGHQSWQLAYEATLRQIVRQQQEERILADANLRRSWGEAVVALESASGPEAVKLMERFIGNIELMDLIKVLEETRALLGNPWRPVTLALMDDNWPTWREKLCATYISSDHILSGPHSYGEGESDGILADLLKAVQVYLEDGRDPDNLYLSIALPLNREMTREESELRIVITGGRFAYVDRLSVSGSGNFRNVERRERLDLQLALKEGNGQEKFSWPGRKPKSELVPQEDEKDVNRRSLDTKVKLVVLPALNDGARQKFKGTDGRG